MFGGEERTSRRIRNIGRMEERCFIVWSLALSLLSSGNVVDGLLFASPHSCSLGSNRQLLLHEATRDRSQQRIPTQTSTRTCDRRFRRLRIEAYPAQRGSCQKAPEDLFSFYKWANGQQSLPLTNQNNGVALTLSEVDVLYERSTELVYDQVQDRYRKVTNADYGETSSISHSDNNPRRGLHQLFWRVIAPRLSVAFIPSGVTPNYYSFMRWRVLQRFVNANLHVFGTQSLLMGLGIKSSSSQLGALSAALNWVLKDALGKIVRMTWASRMGRRFDSDAKRWRFRSAFVYALGNFLEITTYIIPNMFLVWATLANCCKQVSMLTSSSTRTAIYNSFRDGSRENIGDITAKGEAQIAVVDLLGIASGVSLSRFVGTSVQSILAVYAILQAMEIVCMYRQLRTVVYRVLNFERLTEVINEFLDTTVSTPDSQHLAQKEMNGASHNMAVEVKNNHSLTVIESNNRLPMAAEQSLISREAIDTQPANGIKTPQHMARTERIFLPPKRLARRATAFGSLGRTKLSPQELDRLLEIFAKEKFLLVVGHNIKTGSSQRRQRTHPKTDLLKESCHIVLHKDATNLDIVKSSLALLVLRRELAASEMNPWTVRSCDCFEILQYSLQQAEKLFNLFRKQLHKQGWESPGRFMFGRVHMRADWPLRQNKKLSKSFIP